MVLYEFDSLQDSKVLEDMVCIFLHFIWTKMTFYSLGLGGDASPPPSPQPIRAEQLVVVGFVVNRYGIALGGDSDARHVTSQLRLRGRQCVCRLYSRVPLLFYLGEVSPLCSFLFLLFFSHISPSSPSVLPEMFYNFVDKIGTS